MPQLKKIDHIAIATDDLEKSLQFYCDKLGLQCSGIEELPERGIKIAMLPIGDINLELFAPLHDKSEISAFLTNKGPGIHHIAFESADVAADMQELQEKGLPFTTQTPTLGAHQSSVAFIHPKASNKVLLELVEKAK